MEFHSHKLQNGIRVLHIAVPHTKVAHCGLILNTGSRHELPSELGIAHFIEHMIFKGTARRKTYHILNYLESVGGDINAYTTKEKTVVYASIRKEYFLRATELLTDITFHSTFPEKEIVKERQVIAEEIDMYRDTPEEAIFEDFDEQIFPGHSLGHPILGSKESISAFGREDLKRFIAHNYTGESVVFASIGDLPFSRVLRTAEKYLGHLDLPESRPPLGPLSPYKATQVVVDSAGQQAHQLIGNRAYARRQDLYIPFYLLNNYLGGPANNTRLNLNIRERFGLTYSVYSSYTSFADSGLWSVYFGCEPSNLNRINKLVHKELKDLRTRKLGSLRLSQIKKQLIGQLTISNENWLSQMLAAGKNMLDHNRFFTLEDLVKDVEEVTASQMLETANHIFDPNNLSTLTYLPAD